MSTNHVIKILNVADVHQSKTLFGQLSDAVEQHQPDVVACVGDVLDALDFSAEVQFTPEECAVLLASLPVKHLLFIRGNHEDSNWTQFVTAWPHDRRPLRALYGSAYTIGPLVVVGFPCLTGNEFAWCAHLEAGTTEMKLVPSRASSEILDEPDQWLGKLMRELGPTGRTLWLMHEPPVAKPIGNARTCNAIWSAAIQRFSPRLVISGHDHESPLKNGAWWHRLGSTLCVNVGQQQDTLHYTVVSFQYRATPSPVGIVVQEFPGQRTKVV